MLDGRRAHDEIAGLLRDIVAEFAAALGRADVVAERCERLRSCLHRPPERVDRAALRVLAPFLRRRGGDLVQPVATLFEELLPAAADPWPLVRALVDARDAPVVARGVERLAEIMATRPPAKRERIVRFLADAAEAEGSPLVEPATLALLGPVLRRLLEAGPLASGEKDSLRACVVGASDVAVRRLAARVLDAEGVDAGVAARQLLSPDDHDFLAPLLAYTRATHADLVEIVPVPGRRPPSAASLRDAAALLGEAALRTLAAEIGWLRLNAGIRVVRQVALSVDGCFPILASPAEAEVLADGVDARIVGRPVLVVAQGERAAAARGASGETERVRRFRAYGLLHAGVLQDFLDFTPLTRARATTMVGRMDVLVTEHGGLFAEVADECAILADVYASLRGKILARLASASEDAVLDAESTRLVQSFEDPSTLTEVRTLHGLKRYLHQRSLRLASRLLPARASTDRTVDLLRMDGDKIGARVPTLRWADFEPSLARVKEGTLPHAIDLVVDALARPLLHDHREFPSVRAFLYGTEAHYYFSYWSHPVFLRVDYSPPLRGGLVDLEYFGVSKSTLGQHPAPDLDALRAFLHALELDVAIEATHVHARYDKERALDAGDVSEKAAAVLRLAPYLMDLDWIVGSLRLPLDARRRVAAAWARAFASRGVIPVAALLTADRTGVLAGYEEGPSGRRERVWSGAGECPDRFAAKPSEDALARWAHSLRRLGLDAAAAATRELRSFDQLHVERAVLRPMREAIARGQLRDDGDSVQTCGEDLYREEHEAELFAERLRSGQGLGTLVRFARLLAPVERSLRFTTTGTVQGCEVQRAPVALPGQAWGVFVLRDGGGIARLAMVASNAAPCRRRASASLPWSANVLADPRDVVARLREANLVDTAPAGTEESDEDEARRVRALLREESAAPAFAPPRGSRVVTGTRVSLGRVAGRARLGLRRRAPADVEGCVLFAPSVAPVDYPLLHRAAAIVSTGGGALSHAGLVANQLGKPALVVPGAWRAAADGSLSLSFDVLEWSDETREIDGLRVTIRRDLGTRELRLLEDDLVVVDADGGRIEILGAGRLALAFHDDFRRFHREGEDLARARDEREVLVRRGRSLRTQRRLEEELATMEDGLLACHAVREILLGPLVADADAGGAAAMRSSFLRRLLANPTVGAAAAAHLASLIEDLRRRERASRDRARRQIPDAETVAEVVLLRLDARRLAETLAGAIASLPGEAPAGAADAAAAADLDSLDRLARARLHGIRRALVARVAEARGEARMRHDGAALERVDRLLGVSSPRRRAGRAVRDAAERAGVERASTLAGRLVLDGRDGGAELAGAIGPKAGSLGEIASILGPARVPRWFAVTDAAFRRMLASAVDVDGSQTTLEAEVRDTLARSDLDPARRAAAVRGLFEATLLPDDVEAALESAYGELARDSAGEAGPATPSEARPEEPCVAVRSSAREEDLEGESRAGEFETYLGVRGRRELSRHVRLVWAGLWTERAIRTRALLGRSAFDVGGGVIVQRVADARVSGVLQTIDVAGGQPRELVVDVGLGLGEGVVSGAVATDEIRVARGGSGSALRFRYITRDKTEQVVFDRRGGLGTVRVPTRSHQRLRPALEYVELEELVRAALALEDAWGHPLDIEFAFEGSELRILQARPVSAFFAALRATLDRHPLATRRAAAPGSRGELRHDPS